MYVNVYVPKSGGSVVPKSDVYKYSDPFTAAVPWKLTPSVKIALKGFARPS